MVRLWNICLGALLLPQKDVLRCNLQRSFKFQKRSEDSEQK